MGKSNRFLFLATAPFLGMFLAVSSITLPPVRLEKNLLSLDLNEFTRGTTAVQAQLDLTREGIGLIRLSTEDQQRQYEEQQRLLQELVQRSQEQKEFSDEVYEQQITARLGTPVDVHRSDQVEVMVFKIIEKEYRGYAAKVKLFNPEAIEVALGQGQPGKAETTLDAVQRTGAVLGINGGGFYWTSRQGEPQIVPIGNTMINGELVGGFSPSHDDLFFAGFSRESRLIGGVFSREEELLALNPREGVSFVPVLLAGRLPQNIPAKWQREKQPRTVIGQYANGDLLMMVIDGRQAGWSNGATLEELQIKLMQLGVVDAYNLDGGGSSTFVFNGKVLNRPSDGNSRPVATNILVYP
ncbi:multidrug transporter [Clostridiales bacterium PH28_bin88]|nr:multidrug transporter [Clostridiales bacterium PH28_bin88]